MSQTTTPSGADALNRDALAELINSHMTSVYHCTRVWEAWSYGTMSESDFKPADESSLAGEIADEILSTAVAALIARNAELEAERDALRHDWRQLNRSVTAERKLNYDALSARIAEHDALAGENKALREALKSVSDLDPRDTSEGFN